MRRLGRDAPAAELCQARWWRRVLAGTIDVSVAVAAIAPAMWLAIRRRRGAVGAERLEPRGERFVRAVGGLFALARRLGRTPGFRVAGLELRDPVTGRPPGLGRAALRTAIDELPRWVTRWATSAERERERARTAERRRAFDANLQVVRSLAREDPEHLHEAAATFRSTPLGFTFPWRFFVEQILVGQAVRTLLGPLRRRLDARVVTVRRGSI
jgi:hypothetical protein